MLNDDCIEYIWKLYFKNNCVRDIWKVKCPDCDKIKKKHMEYCMRCGMIRAGFTPSFIMLFSAWKALNNN